MGKGFGMGVDYCIIDPLGDTSGAFHISHLVVLDLFRSWFRWESRLHGNYIYPRDPF